MTRIRRRSRTPDARRFPLRWPCEKFGIDGTRFLRSVALGYDIGTRVTAMLGKLQYMFESHRSTHGIASNFVASAAAACAANLNHDRARGGGRVGTVDGRAASSHSPPLC